MTREWQSPQGKRTVEHVGDVPGCGRRAYIKTEGMPGHQLVREEDLEREIKVDESWVAHNTKVKREKEEQARLEQEQLAGKRGLYGFTAGMSSVKARKIEEALDKQQGFNGQFTKRRIFVEKAVREGAVVTEKDRLEWPDGRYFTERDVTKTGLEYAKHLKEIGFV